jgi:hypothetical protein
MVRKKTGLYSAIAWLLDHPDSTAYEIWRGIGEPSFGDGVVGAIRVFEWLTIAEREEIVMRYRVPNEITPRWKANIAVITGRVPGGPGDRPSLGSDTTAHG